MSVRNYLTRGARNYLQNSGGHFAVVTALIGLPLLLGVSVALDLGNASAKRANISAAVDAAALAAVIPANMTDKERVAFAKEAFTKNYFGQEDINLDVKATRERVDIGAHTQIPTLLSSIAGKDYLDVRESASAIVTSSDVICALALDPIGAGAIDFGGKVKFTAPECSVQVNSSHRRAMISTAGTPPSAKSFCVFGGHTGRYSPPARSSCTKIEDPYKGVPTPVSGPCDHTNYRARGTKEVLNPGTYCGGLQLVGAKVQFKPGLYIIEDGPLKISGKTVANGSGVTFAFKGIDTVFSNSAQSKVDFVAPDTGTYKGLIMFQDRHSNPGGENTLVGGTYVRLVGTLYFPTQTISVGGNGDLGTLSEATSYIANRLAFAGGSKVAIHVNHEAGGIPPILPRSDEGARLIK